MFKRNAVGRWLIIYRFLTYTVGALGTIFALIGLEVSHSYYLPKFGFITVTLSLSTVTIIRRVGLVGLEVSRFQL